MGPDLARITPGASAAGVRALAASASRQMHVLRAIAVEALTALDERLPASARTSTAARLALATRDVEDAVRVGRALKSLPKLAVAFRSGRASYTKIRAAVRKAVPATDAAWADLVVRRDTPAVEAFATATAPGAPPPRTPFGMDPLLRIGTPVRERLFCVLDSGTAQRMARLRETLGRLADRRVDTPEALATLAGWYLSANAPQRRDVVVYQRSPESRVPGAAVLAPALAALSSTTDRLRAAFPHLRATLAVPGKARRAWDSLRRALAAAGAGAEAAADTRSRRYIPRDTHNAVRWRDGQVCVVPGCRTALAVQHDHGHEVSRGGRADPIRDHRLCGPCNRAKYRGEIQTDPLPDGSVRVTDRWGTPVGTPSTMGLTLDLPLLARLWALGIADVLAGALRFASLAQGTAAVSLTG